MSIQHKNIGNCNKSNIFTLIYPFEKIIQRKKYKKSYHRIHPCLLSKIHIKRRKSKIKAEISPVNLSKIFEASLYIIKIHKIPKIADKDLIAISESPKSLSKSA